MCGRFSLSVPDEALLDYFELADLPSLTPRYNVAPTQSVAVVRPGPPGGGNRLDLLRWGLVPRWAKDLKIGVHMINARLETAAEKPSFRSAFRKRRCLVPADGFYEWVQGPRGAKRPIHFRIDAGGVFGFAGLWEHWTSPGGEEVESFSILTTAANEVVEQIHERMPVIVPRAAHRAWLDPGLQDPAEARGLLTPFAAERFDAREVSRAVNDVRNDSPDCLRGPGAQGTLPGFG